jgi:hypothetical protein
MEFIINPLGAGVLGLLGLAFAELAHTQALPKPACDQLWRRATRYTSGSAMDLPVKLRSVVTLVIAPSSEEGIF